MLDSNVLLEFSHTHCIAICAALVPANLLATLQTVIFTRLCRSQAQVWLTASVASLYALLMVLHVLTWFLIGVVMVPTYVLLLLGTACLSTNFWAVTNPASVNSLLDLLQSAISPLHRWVLQPFSKRSCQFLKHELPVESALERGV